MSYISTQFIIDSMINTIDSSISLTEKAQDWIKEKKIDGNRLMYSSIIVDMFPLNKQYSALIFNYKIILKGLFAIEFQSKSDQEITDLKTAIEKLEEIKEFIIDQKIDKEVLSKSDSMIPFFGDIEIPEKVYILKYVIPNIYFHSTTLYNILRKNGMNLGKKDFLNF